MSLAIGGSPWILPVLDELIDCREIKLGALLKYIPLNPRAFLATGQRVLKIPSHPDC